MRTVTRMTLAASAAWTIGGFVSVAAAQQSTTEPVAQKAGLIEEVVVTARRRAEDLEKVPVSITALSGDDLKRQNVTVSTDLQFSVPGLTLTGVAGTRENPPISLRGQGQTFGGALPSVQSYFAEIPIPGSMSSLYDMQSVQVLKGPQGTLFGRNTTGGAILYTPAKPTDEFGGYVTAKGGNLGYHEFEGALNLPLGDRAALRVSGDILRRSGYTRDLTTGVNLDDQHRNDLRASLSVRPTENITSDLVATGYTVRQNGTSEILYSAPPGGLLSAFPFFAGLYHIQDYLAAQQASGDRTTWSVAGHPEYFNRDYWLIGDTTTIDLGGVQLKNIIGYQETRTINLANLAGLPGSVLYQGGPSLLNPHGEKGGTGQFSEEFHLSGVAFDGALNWLAGVSYIHEHPVGTVIQTVVVLSTASDPANDNPGLDTGYTTTDDYGVFAQGTYDLSNLLAGLSLTAGGRYSVNKQSLTALSGQQGTTGGVPNGQFICVIPGFDPATPVSQCDVNLDATFKAPSWTVSLDYQVTPDTLVYVASRRGFKAGGFNAFAVDPSLYQYGPEKLTDVEVGMKATWRLSEAVQLRSNIAGYYSVVDNIQRFAFFTTTVNGMPVGVTVTRNAGRGKVDGVEVQETAAFGEHFELDVNYAYTNASITPAPGVAAGTSFGGVPKHVASVTGIYRLPIDPAKGEASLSATWYWQSRMPFLDNLDSEPEAFAPAYSLINLRADWRNVMGTRVDLGAFVDNLADKAFLVDGVIGLDSSLGYAVHSFGAPRTFGVDLTYHFN